MERGECLRVYAGTGSKRAGAVQSTAAQIHHYAVHYAGGDRHFGENDFLKKRPLREKGGLGE